MLKFDDKEERGIGKIVGYVLAYFIFTTLLYFVLIFLKKISESWTYFHIMAITLLIVGFGSLIKRLLK